MVNLELKTGNLVQLAIDYNNNGIWHQKGEIGIIAGYTLFFHIVTMQKSGVSLRLMDDEIINVE